MGAGGPWEKYERFVGDDVRRTHHVDLVAHGDAAARVACVRHRRDRTPVGVGGVVVTVVALVSAMYLNMKSIRIRRRCGLIITAVILTDRIDILVATLAIIIAFAVEVLVVAAASLAPARTIAAAEEVEAPAAVVLIR